MRGRNDNLGKTKKGGAMGQRAEEEGMPHRARLCSKNGFEHLLALTTGSFPVTCPEAGRHMLARKRKDKTQTDLGLRKSVGPG